MGNELTVFQEFQGNIVKMQDKFKTVLPTHIKPEKFTNVVITAVRGNPKLLDGSRQSLFNACMICAQDGLIPDGREAALVKFGSETTYMPMVSGILKKVRNSGELGMIDSAVVYENDEYESWTDEKGPHFKHKRVHKDKGKPVLTYAYANTKDGFVYFEEIDEDQMKGIKGKAKTKTVWEGPFKDEMKRKSAIRRLCKRLPLSTDIEQLFGRDDEMYDLEKEEKKEEPAEPVKSSLEDVVTSQVDSPATEDVEEAEFKEEKPKRFETEGIVEDIKTKKGETNGKKWTKYGCKINGKYLGTFSESDYRLMLASMENKQTVRAVYETSQVGEKTFYNIIEMKDLWDEEKKEVSEEDIPI